MNDTAQAQEHTTGGEDLTLYKLTLYALGCPEGQAEVAIGLGAARRRVTALRAEALAREEAHRQRGADADSPAEAKRAAAYAATLDELAASAEPQRGELWVFNFDTGTPRGIGGLLQVTPVDAADEGALLYESDCEESLWALAREAGIDFEEERCDPLALLWSLRGQHLPD
jgi:hypothetical protein